ncbi:MAG TPA: hypothetical protein VK898_07210 [Chloroflexota bacterium]|nr:hypothetical protein [Chloroflexota bacterium]
MPPAPQRAVEPTPLPATQEPTAEPTFETQVIDVSNDRNARSQRTPVAREPTATPVPTAQPSPTTPPRAADLVDGVVAQSFEPVLVGGRLGLAGAAVTGLVLLALRAARRRR